MFSPFPCEFVSLAFPKRGKIFPQGGPGHPTHPMPGAGTRKRSDAFSVQGRDKHLLRAFHLGPGTVLRVCAAAAAAALCAALFGVRAADAGFAAFLCPKQIIHDSDCDAQEYHNDDCILHDCLLNVYSDFSFLFVFIMRPAITAIMAATAIRPPTAAPTLRGPPVTSVPMV